MFANVGFRTLRTSRGSIYGMFVILLLGVLIANFTGHLLIDSESNISRIIGSCSQVINFSKRTFYSSAKDGYQSNGSNGDGYSANAQTCLLYTSGKMLSLDISRKYPKPNGSI